MLRRLLHKIVPPENSLPLAITGLMNLIAFSGPKLLQVLGWSLPMHDMTAAFDRAFPFSPVWVFVYVAAFPFWIYQYSVVAKESRSLCYRLVAADFAAKVICLLFFVLLPTHNVRPPLETGGFTGCAPSAPCSCSSRRCSRSSMCSTMSLAAWLWLRSAGLSRAIPDYRVCSSA